MLYYYFIAQHKYKYYYWLLREAFRSEVECSVSQKRRGNKKGSVLENAGNIEVLQIILAVRKRQNLHYIIMDDFYYKFS